MRHGGNVWQGETPSEWLDYSANLRPEGTPEWVRDALLRGMENTRYYPDSTMKRATAAMAEYLGVDARCVRPTAGGISAIQMANQLPSSETVLLTPCFCEYEQFASTPVRKISLLQEKHAVRLPQQLDLKENSLVWLCNPMNPVGAAFDQAQIKTLLTAVEAANSYLAVDEAFIEYCAQNSVVQWTETHERLLITGSMTKILGIPGVRFGYLCAHPTMLEKLQKRQLTWELSCFAESVACALPEHQAEIHADAQRNAQRRNAFVAELQALGLFVYPSQSACVLVDFGRDTATIEEKLKEQKILVRNCMSFDDIADGRHLRLAVKDEASNRRFLQALKEVLSCAENR